jgi:hypothetical protein
VHPWFYRLQVFPTAGFDFYDLSGLSGKGWLATHGPFVAGRPFLLCAGASSNAFRYSSLLPGLISALFKQGGGF